MSKASHSARVGAAALALGVSIGASCAASPVAAADPPVSGTAQTNDAASPTAARTVRGPKPAAASDTAGARRTASQDSGAGPTGKPRSRHTTGTDQVDLGTTNAVSPQPAAAATDPAATDSPVPSLMTSPMAARTRRSAPAPSDGVLGPAAPAALLLTVTPAQPSAPAAVAAPPAVLNPVSALATARPSAAAGILGGLFGPIKNLFEGAGLLVRRNLFNQAPTVSPVQLTGQSSGPITGTIGAVDPEGDPLRYKITSAPQYGAVTVGTDGSYTYTPGAGFTGSDSFVVAVTDTGFHLNLFGLKRPKSVSTSVAVRQGALAPMLSFQFVYGAGAQYWSSAARSALESAATRLASYLIVTSPITITYDVTGNSAPLSSTLASSGSDLLDGATGFVQTVVQSKIQTGVDPNGATADGVISWNFGPNWGFGDTVSNGQYDFQSTAMHELLHTLGFLSNVDKAGNNTGTTWTVYDSFLVDSTGAPVIGGDYTWNTAYNPNLTGRNGGLYLGGTNAVAAYGGLVPVYTPAPWSSGSSISHLNDSAFTGVNRQLMNAVSGQGQGVRVLSPVELGILADIGYHVSTGSGTSTLMFIGFFVIRRARRKD